jgi:hypothetical protein
MGIQNRIGLTGFTRSFSSNMREGSPAEMDLPKARSYRNPLLPQTTTVTIAGFDTNNDAVTVAITLPNGVIVSLTVTRTGGAPADDTASAAALEAQVDASQPLNGHVEASAAAGVLTLAFQHAGIEYPVATTVTGCTATVANSQAAGGSALPLGRFVAAGTSLDGIPAIRQLTSTDRDANVRGILLAPHAVFPNADSASPTATDVIPIGELGAVVYDGAINMRNNGDVATTVGGVVFAVVGTGGGDEVGEARSDVDGVAGVWTVTPTAAELDFMVLIEWTSALGVKESIPLLSANPDGSANATEICDAWRTAFATAQADGKLTGFTAGGTATLTLTGPAGVPFTVSDVGEGVSATVETTPAVVYATPLDVKRFYWAEVIAPGAVGRIMTRA